MVMWKEMGELDENEGRLQTTSPTTVKGYHQWKQNLEGKESYIRGMGGVHSRIANPLIGRFLHVQYNT